MKAMRPRKSHSSPSRLGRWGCRNADTIRATLVLDLQPQRPRSPDITVQRSDSRQPLSMRRKFNAHMRSRARECRAAAGDGVEARRTSARRAPSTPGSGNISCRSRAQNTVDGGGAVRRDGRESSGDRAASFPVTRFGFRRAEPIASRPSRTSGERQPVLTADFTSIITLVHGASRTSVRIDFVI